MPPGGLTRDTRRLLRTVGNRPHATDDDHHDLPRTPPPSNPKTHALGSDAQPVEIAGVDVAALEDNDDDIYGSPISSVEEDQNQTVAGSRIGVVGSSDEQSPSSAPVQTEGDHGRGTDFVLSQSSVTSTGSASKKRSSPSAMSTSDDDFLIFERGSQTKRSKGSVQNIHARQANPTFRTKTYSRLANKQSSQGKEKKEFHKPPEAKMQPSSETRFILPDVFQFGKEDSQKTFQTARTASNAPAKYVEMAKFVTPSFSASSSSLSSAKTTPDPEEIVAMRLPAPTSYDPKVECTICGEHVQRSLRQDFEDEYNHGKQLNYKWQQRFCRYHKQHHALLLWNDREYPKIDWEQLGSRLRARKHTNHLKRVLSGEAPSVFRDRLAQMLKGGSKTTAQVIAAEGEKKSGGVGYYGPRGEKLMTDHIVAHFADQLRHRATKDKLVAAAGVSGGVSGFVQAVLVPELAASLVEEDLGVSKEGAIEILAESADLGELLHPEQEDTVMEIEDEDAND